VSRVLIVDDNENNLAVLAELLSMEGVDFTAVIDPPDAETVLEQAHGVDAIFLDLKMPGVSGYEILTLLRSHPQLHAVPVVACSVHVNEVNQAKAQGFHSFLAKPLDFDLFPDQFARILRGERVWAI
jgi:two-component system, cell cycle response regulator DivK